HGLHRLALDPASRNHNSPHRSQYFSSIRMCATSVFIFILRVVSDRTLREVLIPAQSELRLVLISASGLQVVHAVLNKRAASTSVSPRRGKGEHTSARRRVANEFNTCGIISDLRYSF